MHVMLCHYCCRVLARGWSRTFFRWAKCSSRKNADFWREGHFSLNKCIVGSLSVAGTIFGIVGSFSLSLFSILTKKVLPKIDGEIWVLQYANNVYASILFLPIIFLTGEVQVVLNYPRLNDLLFWTILIGGGLCGFMIGFFTSLQIKVRFWWIHKDLVIVYGVFSSLLLSPTTYQAQQKHVLKQY